MKLTMWLKERELNARRLAAGRTGADRAGWLEDADHFQAALAAVEERDRLRAALETIVGFAPGNGDVCEIIAKRARDALRP